MTTGKNDEGVRVLKTPANKGTGLHHRTITGKNDEGVRVLKTPANKGTGSHHRATTGGTDKEVQVHKKMKITKKCAKTIVAQGLSEDNSGSCPTGGNDEGVEVHMTQARHILTYCNRALPGWWGVCGEGFGSWRKTHNVY